MLASWIFGDDEEIASSGTGVGDDEDDAREGLRIGLSRESSIEYQSEDIIFYYRAREIRRSRKSMGTLT